MTSYIESIQQFQNGRSQRLTAHPRNWLSLIGLFPLEEGQNRFGSDSDCKITLPSSPVPLAGTLTLADGKVTLSPSPQVEITMNGGSLENRPLRTDVDGDPDIIEFGTLSLMIIQRGGNQMLRVWDKDAPAVRNYKGLNFFPINPDFCVSASFITYDPPIIKKTYDAIGIEHDSAFVGQAKFILHGCECTFEAQEDDDELLFNFTDETRKDQSYPGGRYLLTPKAKDEKVVLDFNKAVNWPCAYTSYATCPLPPFENRLPVRIEAGERRYHD